MAGSHGLRHVGRALKRAKQAMRSRHISSLGTIDSRVRWRESLLRKLAADPATAFADTYMLWGTVARHSGNVSTLKGGVHGQSGRVEISSCFGVVHRYVLKACINTPRHQHTACCTYTTSLIYQLILHTYLIQYNVATISAIPILGPSREFLICIL